MQDLDPQPLNRRPVHASQTQVLLGSRTPVDHALKMSLWCVGHICTQLYISNDLVYELSTLPQLSTLSHINPATTTYYINIHQV